MKTTRQHCIIIIIIIIMVIIIIGAHKHRHTNNVFSTTTSSDPLAKVNLITDPGTQDQLSQFHAVFDVVNSFVVVVLVVVVIVVDYYSISFGTHSASTQ